MRFTRANLRKLFEYHAAKRKDYANPLPMPDNETLERIYRYWKDKESFLIVLSRHLEGHGVEYIYDKKDRWAAKYINMGEAYALTVVYDARDEVYRIESWGDWVERQPKGRIP